MSSRPRVNEDEDEDLYEKCNEDNKIQIQSVNLNNEKRMSDNFDMPSLVSLEILESQAIDSHIKKDDIMRRVNEMNKIISDAENYLADEKSTQSDKEEHSWDDITPEILRLKPADSLLLLNQIKDDENVNSNGKMKGIVLNCI